MPDEITPPGSGATPAEPSAIPYAGAPVPPPTVQLDCAVDETLLIIHAGAAVRISPRLAGASALTDLSILAAPAALVVVDAALPASVDTIDFGTGCEAGDWPDALIAALPDRSVAGDGSYTDAEAILSSGQTAALEAKGFFEA